MNNYPLYHNPKTPSQVNPSKIVPSIAKTHKKPNQLPETILSSMGKEKKIVKGEKRKNYKTKMCPEGRQCRKRMFCQYAHTEQELRRCAYIPRKQPCLQYQRGKCSLGSACRKYHGNMDLKRNYQYKQNICELYLQGKCTKGKLCINIHEQPQEQQIQQIEESPMKIQQEVEEGSEEPKQQKKGQVAEYREEKVEEEEQIVEGGFFLSF